MGARRRSRQFWQKKKKKGRRKVGLRMGFDIRLNENGPGLLTQDKNVFYGMPGSKEIEPRGDIGNVKSGRRAFLHPPRRVLIYAVARGNQEK